MTIKGFQYDCSSQSSNVSCATSDYKLWNQCFKKRKKYCIWWSKITFFLSVKPSFHGPLARTSLVGQQHSGFTLRKKSTVLFWPSNKYLFFKDRKKNLRSQGPTFHLKGFGKQLWPLLSGQTNWRRDKRTDKLADIYWGKRRHRQSIFLPNHFVA